MKLRIGLLILLYLFTSAVSAAQYVAGDLAPRGNPDGQLNVADVLILQRIIGGYDTASSAELKIADVGPLNSPDGVLDIVDVLLLQRIIRGDIAQSNITVIPQAPVLNSIPATTSSNPLPITGTASPLMNIDIYVNGVLQQQTISDIGGNVISDINLSDASNAVYAVVSDGVDVSPSSNTLTTDYTNTLSRIQSGVITEDSVWTPGVPAQAYVLSAALTVANGVSITLMPGVVVELGNNTLTVDGALVLEAGSRVESSGSSRINVTGNLTVNGTATDAVVLTSSQATPTPNSWGGIQVSDGGTVAINYAEIDFAFIGIDFRPGSGGTANAIPMVSRHREIILMQRKIRYL